MKRIEVRQFVKDGVNAITPVLEFNEGRVSEFAAKRSNEYPSTLLLLEQVEVSISNNMSAPSDAWRIVVVIFQIDALDSLPDQYEGLVDSCDEIAQKLTYKYRNIVEGFKRTTMSNISRTRFIKSPKYGPDCLTGIELQFILNSPDLTNVC